MWLLFAACHAPVAAPLAPLAPAPAPVPVCEAARRAAAYAADHPAMAPWVDVLAFASEPYSGADGCALAPSDALRLEEAPAADVPCPPGSERWERIRDDEAETACVGPMATGDGAFAMADEGRYYTGSRTVRDGGWVVLHGAYEGGRALVERTWEWDDAGQPVLVSVRSFRPDGHLEAEEWLDEARRRSVRIEYAGPGIESRRITWLASGASTSVQVATAEGHGPPRIVRELVLTDGVAAPAGQWVSEGYSLDRELDEFRARPTVRTDFPCRDDDSVHGGDGYTDKWVWWRYGRAEVEVPDGATRMRYPPGWAVVPGGRPGRIDVLVEQTRERLQGGRPFEPCDGFGDAGLRVRREGGALAFWSFGVWEAERDASGIQAVLVLPDGVTGVEDPALYSRSERASAGDADDAATVQVRRDPTGVIEVFGPLVAERSAFETFDFRVRTKRPRFPRPGTAREGLPYDRGGDFVVSSPRQEVADVALEVFRAAEGGFLGCFGEVMKVAPTATGTVSAAVSVTPAGAVEFVHLISWRYGENRLTQRPELEAARDRADACLEDRLRALAFPPDPDGKDLVVDAILTLPDAPVGLGRVRGTQDAGVP